MQLKNSIFYIIIIVILISLIKIISYGILKFYHLRAVNMLNEELKDFSKKNVIFFDTISILKKGADIVSSHLSTILIK